MSNKNVKSEQLYEYAELEISKWQSSNRRAHRLSAKPVLFFILKFKDMGE